MAAGFRAVANLDELTDEQLAEHVLSNWHKLHKALAMRPSAEVLRRMLRLELARGHSLREPIARRLRQALSGALAREADVALELSLRLISHDVMPPPIELLKLGLTADDAREISRSLEERFRAELAEHIQQKHKPREIDP